MSYIEQEVKILDVNVEVLCSKLRELGAVEVFNADRVITHFDAADGHLTKEGKTMKLTEEGKLKLSIGGAAETGQKETVKLFVSRKQEAVDFLARLGIKPISESTSRRISFEWSGIDFDIDQFPKIPAFLEIDLGESGMALQDVLAKLGLEKNQVVEMSTPDIYEKYGHNYFELFKLTV